jgi:hypothetical protein
LAAKGLKVATGTIVDATIINAPSSTKNADKARDPEMHQTKKGNQWYFGMKAHFGVDSRTKLIHAAVVTPANVADSTVLPGHRQLVVSGQLNLSQRQWELTELLPTHTADFSPNLKFLGPGSSMLGSSDMIAAEMEEVVDLIVGGEEPLRLAGRFELLHLPLSAARRLVRVFRSVVEPLVLAMLDAGHDLSFGRTVAGQLVGDHDAWRSHLLLQQLA